jgi:polysaccharide pyruvyl transferase WcaK-like protein
MPAALLAGAFGQGNLGDDALLQSFVAALPDWDLTVTTGDRAAAERLGCRAVTPGALGATGRAVLAADAVVVGGGTIFKTLHPSAGRHPLGLLATASALTAATSVLRRPVAMVGVGAGALGPGPARAMTRFIVRRSDLLILRDEAAAWTLLGAGASGPFRVGADPAWTLLRPPGASASRDLSVRVIPSFLASAPEDIGALRDLLVSTMRLLAARGVRLQLQSWQERVGDGGPGDGELVAAIAAELGPSVDVIERPASLPAAAESMAGIGAVLSFRFHALLAAAAAGTPAVAVAHEAKLGSLGERLGQRVVPSGATPGVLVEQVTAALKGPGPTPAAVKEQIELADEGFRLLRVLLSRGKSDESNRLGALPLTPTPRSS